MKASSMMKRSSVALLVLAVSTAAYAPAADAGKGKLRRDASIGRNKSGVVFSEQLTHTKGIRSKVTGGLLGKTMGVKNAQNADGVQTTLGRGRIRPPERVTYTTTGVPMGTKTESTHHKRGALMRWKNRLTTSRTEEITQGAGGDPDVGTTETARHRFTLNPFSNKPGKVHEVEADRMEVDQETGADDMEGVIEKLDGQGNVRQARDTGGRRWGKAFRSKLEGRREVAATPNGVEMTDTFQAKWGFWRMVKKGLSFGLAEGGGKAVTVEHTRTAYGTEVVMTTPRERATRVTEIGEGRTTSNGTYRRNGILFDKAEKDSVVIDGQKGIRTVEALRPGDGTTKKATTTTQFVNGARAVETETAGKYKIRASSPRQGGGTNWMRAREGKFFSWQYGRANGNFRARLDTPWFNMGRTVFEYNAATGEVSNMPVEQAVESFEPAE